ncbi:hypothetical protein NPIL_199851, partial [Nephila pilipes]
EKMVLVNGRHQITTPGLPSNVQ